MRAHGVLFLSDAEPQASTAADGTFVLTLRANDCSTPVAPPVPWVLIWTGLGASIFWAVSKTQLAEAVVVYVECDTVMPLSYYPNGLAIHGRVSRLSLSPLPSNRFGLPAAEPSAIA